MYLRAVGRRLTQMIAYFLVMNSKRCITKRNKLIRFADKSPTGWTGVEEYESDELAEDSEDEKRLRSAERRALAKIREKKRRNSSARPSYTSTRQPSSEVSSAGPSNTLPVNQQLFRGQSFRERRPQPSDKCFSCGQRGHWANSTSCPSRLRGTVAVPSSSKAANWRQIQSCIIEIREKWV